MSERAVSPKVLIGGMGVLIMGLAGAIAVMAWSSYEAVRASQQHIGDVQKADGERIRAIEVQAELWKSVPGQITDIFRLLGEIKGDVKAHTEAQKAADEAARRLEHP
jgi:hypothetical protein